MSDKKPRGTQVQDINFQSPFVQHSLDLTKQDMFVTSLAVDFLHYKALPSPIGKSDRGDYRRSDGVDTVTSNGMIFKCAGKFSAAISNNERRQKNAPSVNLLDPSQMRIIMPRFYNEGEEGQSNGKRIYLAPGDRIYIADKDADVKVANYQEMTYEQGVDNVPMFPIKELEAIVDSRNIEYVEGADFTVTSTGSIRWNAGGRNPGIDPDTGKGRVYSIRYLYEAYWYVVSLPHEVRMTAVTQGSVRSPQRMAYHAVLVREYIFHNQNPTSKVDQIKPTDRNRESAKPLQNLNINQNSIVVDMAAIGDNEDEEQS